MERVGAQRTGIKFIETGFVPPSDEPRCNANQGSDISIHEESARGDRSKFKGVADEGWRERRGWTTERERQETQGVERT